MSYSPKVSFPGPSLLPIVTPGYRCAPWPAKIRAVFMTKDELIEKMLSAKSQQ
jgi:hypothetical protein